MVAEIPRTPGPHVSTEKYVISHLVPSVREFGQFMKRLRVPL